MPITLNHTIVHAKDKRVSAAFLADILGLQSPTPYGPFLVVQVGDTSLDYADDHAPRGFQRQHFAFLVREARADVLGRPRPPAGGGDQPWRRRPRPLLGRSRRTPPGDPDGSVRGMELRLPPRRSAP